MCLESVKCNFGILYHHVTDVEYVRVSCVPVVWFVSCTEYSRVMMIIIHTTTTTSVAHNIDFKPVMWRPVNGKSCPVELSNKLMSGTE